MTRCDRRVRPRRTPTGYLPPEERPRPGRRRPGYAAALPPEKEAELRAQIARATEGCDFCAYEQRTARDPWGRLESRLSYVASNVAKYQGYHALIVPKQHSPLDVSLELVCLGLVANLPSPPTEKNANPAYNLFAWSVPYRHFWPSLGVAMKDVHSQSNGVTRMVFRCRFGAALHPKIARHNLPLLAAPGFAWLGQQVVRQGRQPWPYHSLVVNG